MIKAYKIYTGSDGHTHIINVTVTEDQLFHAQSIRFRETPAHSIYAWHPAPTIQYVLTLTGTLQFETFPGETFVLKPGEVLIARYTTGSGHKWTRGDEEPWKRAYITFDPGQEINFVEDVKSS